MMHLLIFEIVFYRTKFNNLKLIKPYFKTNLNNLVNRSAVMNSNALFIFRVIHFTELTKFGVSSQNVPFLFFSNLKEKGILVLFKTLS